jgi:putative nucleotidyltransferase with HDIG domain
METRFRLPGAPDRAGGGRAAMDLRSFAHDVVDRIPAMAEARGKALDLARAGESPAGLVRAIESDPVLVLAVLRAANRGHLRGTAASVPAAVDSLGPGRVAAIAADVPAFDPLGVGSHADHRRTGFRAHALSVRNLAERIAGGTGHDQMDELIAAALLHDVGKLALAWARPSYGTVVPDAASPEARLAAEGRALGVDHTQAGGDLARVWGLPDRLCAAIAGHHHPGAEGAALLVGIADMLSHYGADRPIDLERLGAASRKAGLDRAVLGEILYELPLPVVSRRGRPPEGTEPVRELDHPGAREHGRM